MAELLEEKIEADNGEHAVVLPSHAQGALCFDNVSFSYLPGEPVLDQINLNIAPRTTVALVGPTGVGKTTLAGLIPRFYDVDNGRITLDGHDLRDLTLSSLRQQISIVLQDVFLFHGTNARENILFGHADASEEEMIQAAKNYQRARIYGELPKGYDTLIGAYGVKPRAGRNSGSGFRAPCSKTHPILILDEATSSVDTETELLIQQALERLIRGRTTIMIAHRLSTIRNADTIVVLAEKGIAEIGNHNQLLTGAVSTGI